MGSAVPGVEVQPVLRDMAHSNSQAADLKMPGVTGISEGQPAPPTPLGSGLRMAVSFC